MPKKHFGEKKTPVYKMKYQGDPSAFPFKSSPLLGKDEKPGTGKKKKKDTVRKDMSTTTILQQQWAAYQASLPADHPDKGKPVPTQGD